VESTIDFQVEIIVPMIKQNTKNYFQPSTNSRISSRSCSLKPIIYSRIRRKEIDENGMMLK